MGTSGGHCLLIINYWSLFCLRNSCLLVGHVGSLLTIAPKFVINLYRVEKKHNICFKGPVHINRFRASTLLLCLGIVFIIPNIIAYILPLFKMATCSTECLEVLLKHISSYLGLSLSVIIVMSMIAGIILWHGCYLIWCLIWYRNLTNVLYLNNLRDDFDSKVIEIVYTKICNDEILLGLGLALKINLDTLEALRHDNANNIRVAGYHLLRDWQKRMGGLGPKSNGLQKLKIALIEIKLNVCADEIDKLVKKIT